MAEINNSQRKKIVKVGLLETFAELVDTLYGSPMGASGSNHAPGQVPDPGATAGSSKFLCEDGTWKVPSGGGGGNSVSVMGGSGENHASGLVPDPGATAGTTKFLREDGTWNIPTTPTLSTMIDLLAQTYEASINSNGHDYVEIGGVKWATMNVGANSITDTGLYFQWGDTQGYTASQVGSGDGQKYFGWADYKYNNGTSTGNSSTMTKYNATDGKTVLDPSDDAVTAAWGGDWKTPTVSEIYALIDATSQSLVDNYQNSGVSGILFTDKEDNSKTLFFPSTSYATNGVIYGTGLGIYMTKENDPVNVATQLYYFLVNLLNVQTFINFSSRCYGLVVRGVLGTTEEDTNKVLLKDYTWGDINNKEDCVLIKESNASIIFPNVGECYNITNTVTTLSIRLPAITQNFKKLQQVLINFTTGTSPRVTITSSGGRTIKYFSDYVIESDKTYELNCMWNGKNWIIAYGTIG